MKKLRIAYFGTPYFSALFLEKLLTDASVRDLIDLKLVITQPDQPVGRKRILTKSPVRLVAEKYNIEVFAGLLTDSQLIIEKLTGLDIAFLFAYGQIIPKNILTAPKMGFWNTHPSLLPKYRGALPIAMPIIMGDTETGVTLIKLDEKVDHGPVIAQEKLTVNLQDKRPELEVKLTDLAFTMFEKKISELADDQSSKLKTRGQDHSQATFTYQVNKDAGFLPLEVLKKAIIGEPLPNDSIPKIIRDYHLRNNLEIRQGNSKMIYNLFRGLFPWPGLWTKVDIKGQQKRLKITEMQLLNDKLTLKKVQLEGKKEVDFKTFNSAYRLF